MAVSKVIINGQTKIDITDTTATPQDVASDKYFYTADGNRTKGTKDDTAIIEEKDVNFYDYDGTCLYSYTADEALDLIELPPNPSHTGLIAQGWNYTLSDVINECNKYGNCDIGQMYTTDDGNTRIYITIEPNNNYDFSITFSCSDTVIIDWGDASTTSVSKVTNKTSTHLYMSPGDYVVKLRASNNTQISLGGSSTTYYSGTGIFGDKALIYNAYKIKAVEVGDNVVSIQQGCFMSCGGMKTITLPQSLTSIGGNAFYYCFSLSSIVIPSGVKQINQYTFYYNASIEHIVLPSGLSQCTGSLIFAYCANLKRILIPDNTYATLSERPFYFNHSVKHIRLSDKITSLSGIRSCESNVSLETIQIPSVTQFGNQCFYYACSLKSITIPEGTTTINDHMFVACLNLHELTIPSTVNKIQTYAFAYSGITEFHFKPTTPPTISNSNCFEALGSSFKIYVPYSENHSILNKYKTATNWTSRANQIIEENPE